MRVAAILAYAACAEQRNAPSAARFSELFVAGRVAANRPGCARQTGRRRIALAAFERPARIHAGIEAGEIFRCGWCRGEEKQAEDASLHVVFCSARAR